MTPATAFAMTFDTWPPTSGPVRHGITAPVGAIRLGMHGKSQHRQIKIKLDGRPQDRWMKLARFWWIKNKGPVPEGKRVGHIDGDTMNDDPANYALFTAGDVIACYHLDNPEWSEQQHRRCAAGAARFNFERAAAERMRRWLSDRWYAVDFSKQTIVNHPYRERWQVYDAAGVPVRNTSNGRGYIGAVLGWPALPDFAAAVLQELVDAGSWVDSLNLFDRACAVLAHYRVATPTHRASMHSTLWALRRDDLIVSRRGGRRCGTHQPTDRAIHQRRPKCEIVAIRGDELAGDAFRLFNKTIPEAA